MGDYFCGDIEIGGPLKVDDLDGLIKAIILDGPAIGDDYNDMTPNEDEVHQAIDEAIRLGETIKFSDTQANGGQFDTIEEFCVNHGLTFCRHSDGKYEYDAEYVWWQPGMETPAQATSTNDGNVLIDVKELQECMVDGSAEQQIANLKALIDSKAPTSPPPLTMCR